MAEQYVKEFNADLGELSLLTGASIERFNANKISKYNILPEPKRYCSFQACGKNRDNYTR